MSIDEIEPAFDEYFRTIARLRSAAERWYDDTQDYGPIVITDELSHLGQRLWAACQGAINAD